MMPAREPVSGPGNAGVLRALARVDRLLARAVESAQAAYGGGTATDPFRGLYISHEDVEKLLARAPSEPPASAGALDDFARGLVTEVPQLGRIIDAFRLESFDAAVVLVALAPEIDLRYERIFAFLQDDVTRKRPSVDLLLNVLTENAPQKLARRARFGTDSPLIHNGILQLLPDPTQTSPPLLAHYVKLDNQYVRLLTGEAGMDLRLSDCCRLSQPGRAAASEVDGSIAGLARRTTESGEPLRLYFHGPRGGGPIRTAESLAAAIGAPLVAADLERVAGTSADFSATVKLILREAWLRDAVVLFEGLDAVRKEDRSGDFRVFMEAVAAFSGIAILAGAQPWTPMGPPVKGVVVVPFTVPPFAKRREHWRGALDEGGLKLSKDELTVLAARYALTHDQIADAVATASNQALLRAESAGLDELMAAARAQSGQDLARLARKIDPLYTKEDIVLPEDSLEQLREICSRVGGRQRVLTEWGFDGKLSTGRGINALFSGPSGTGKTMAAEIIANELGLDLYRIDLSSVVSKYIGETEKNLEKIFSTAEHANAILLFDEADALFGKRSEVRDSHDRYANTEISYLLQRMEQYEGISILATNLRGNLDDAFVRRLAFTVHFPFPDEQSRRKIWERIWPKQTPLAADVDPRVLAEQYKLSGGNIRNVALAAAFLAAETGGPVTMAHVIHATRREYQKLGKQISEAELTRRAS